ncbi:MAG: class I SAM-dependent methyltransferase [Opitutales bacterium]|nr:class I SAM-dependent methyltransferase [Opitutales bacterium]
MDIKVSVSDWGAHELLDSGEKLKLERFGDAVVIRSEPKAWWAKSRPELWKTAHARYLDDDKKNSRWLFYKKINAPVLDFKGVKFAAKFMDGSKHLGVFPEQSPHWDFIANAAKGRQNPKLLNLFGYTGAATLVAAKNGWLATHVDASKPSVDWARNNQRLSGLEEKPIRWIVDDALKFAQREARRGSKYDAIVLDPPAFGRGPKNELWKLEKMLPQLLQACQNILSDNPLFVMMTLYSIEASALMAKNMLESFFPRLKTECGELALRGNPMPLPLSIWAVASAK